MPAWHACWLAAMGLGQTCIGEQTWTRGQQGRYEQAEEIYRQALALIEIVLGKEHLSTLANMNNLVEVLSRQGKYERAEEIHRQALGLRETVLVKEHPVANRPRLGGYSLVRVVQLCRVV